MDSIIHGTRKWRCIATDGAYVATDGDILPQMVHMYFSSWDVHGYLDEDPDVFIVICFAEMLPLGCTLATIKHVVQASDPPRDS